MQALNESSFFCVADFPHVCAPLPAEIEAEGMHSWNTLRKKLCIFLMCLLQVLPPDMTELSEPSAEGLCAALQRALGRVGSLQPMEQHERVRGHADGRGLFCLSWGSEEIL